MAVEISSYEEFLAGRHGTNHAIPELHLGALTKAYLRGIGTDHIQNRISNYQPAIMGLPSDLSAATSIVGADVKVKVGGSDFSLTPGQQVCESSYDDPVEPLIRIPAAVVDSFNVSSIEPSLAIDMTSALSLMSHEV